MAPRVLLGRLWFGGCCGGCFSFWRGFSRNVGRCFALLNGGFRCFGVGGGGCFFNDHFWFFRFFSVGLFHLYGFGTGQSDDFSVEEVCIQMKVNPDGGRVTQSNGPSPFEVGEEGVETALAATVHDKEELKNEAADLLYHLTVLLQASDMSLNDALDVLRERHK